VSRGLPFWQERFNSVRRHPFWKAIDAPQATEQDEVRLQFMSEVILFMTGVTVALFTIPVVIGWIAGTFDFVPVAIMVFMDFYIGVAHWLLRRGRWRQANVIPIAVFFILGLFGNYYNGPVTNMNLFYVLVILLTAAFYGWKAQAIVLMLSILSPPVIGMAYGLSGVQDLLFMAIPFSGLLIGIALLQWFVTSQLQRALARARTYNEQLVQEVAERKRVEEALRASEERLRLITDNMLDMVAQVDLEGVIEYVSPSHKNVLGYEPDDLLGKSSYDFMHPQDLDKVMAVVQKAFDTNSPQKGAYRHRHADGHYVWLEAIGNFLFDDQGLPTGAVVSTRDITERIRAEEALRESEGRYRQLVEHAPAGIYEVSLTSGLFLSVNDVMCEYTGYTREEFLSLSTLDLLTEESQGRFLERLDKVLAGEPVPELIEYQIRGKNGREFWVILTTRYTFDEEGEVTATVIVHDITERKLEETRKAQLMMELERSLEELKRTQSQLVQAQKMEAIGRLAGGVAHDFQNLLTIIQLSTQLMERQLHPADPLWEQMRQIQEASERGIRLAKQLLSFSRREVVEPQVLDLSQVVSDLSQMLRRFIGEDIELMTILAEDLWPVKVDPSHIKQVIINLAANARDAMPQGGCLTIETANAVLDDDSALRRLDAQPGEYVTLAISDTGVGMDEEVQAHLFEPFFTTKKQGEGTGLGLSTVYGIVRQNAGYIWLHSEAGQGTTFKIYLPRTQEATGPGELPSRLSPATPADAALGTETILVVEDETAVRRLAVQILEAYGYLVLAAGNGVEALQVSREHGGPIHLLLTDVVMPKMNGKELVERLQPEQPGMRIMYMSGYSDDVIAHHDVLDKSIAFLPKPFSLDTLVQQVRTVLDKEKEYGN
jgi:PAS domain S-box-containing protein